MKNILSQLRERMSAMAGAHGGSLARWCLIGLVMLAPGSFLILPLLWLRRNRAAPARVTTVLSI